MAKKSAVKTDIKNVSNGNNNQKLLIATISLLSALLILNVVTLTGYSTKFSTDYSTVQGESTCSRIGGVLFRAGVAANHNGQSVMLRATSEDAVSVDVDGEARTILSGHEVWINGVNVKNFASNENDACLVLS